MVDEPKDILQRAITARGFKNHVAAARHFGWFSVISESGVRHHFNGNRRPSKDNAERYARDLGLSVSELLGLDDADTTVGNIPVEESHVKLGQWLDTEFIAKVTPIRRRPPTLSVPRRVGADMRRSVQVADGSVNRRIRQGDFAVYEPVDKPDLVDLEDRYVYVARRRGGLEERTIRKVSRDRQGKLVLTTDSDDTRYANTVSYPPSHPDEIIEILGLVVGQYGAI